MSIFKTAAAGMIGFAAGAGAMLMPGTQKWKRQMQRQADKMMKVIKNW